MSRMTEAEILEGVAELEAEYQANCAIWRNHVDTTNGQVKPYVGDDPFFDNSELF